ncbi:MAG: hypothetical protein HXY29_14890 [Rhodocyclaceae bacterium]|nr:hypothetical protein [Rhodocyclaceae bacterium]
MRVLLTAPYVGEIGWELMAWQARVRLLFHRGGFDRLVVLGSAGKEAFYQDMPLDYRPVEPAGLPGVAYEDRRLLPDNQPMSRSELRAFVEPAVRAAAGELAQSGCQTHILCPPYAGKPWPCDRRHQRFIRFQSPHPDPRGAPWVVLVPRTRGFGAANWTAAQWEELAGSLDGVGVGISTLPCEAAAAIEMLSACDLAVGQSTGGLHLASLCGCPHLVWAAEPSRLWTPWSITNRQRYQTFWNPLGTPVEFRPVGELPTPAQAAEWTLRALERIGRRTGRAAPRAQFRCTWHWRRWLAKRVLPARPLRYCPWPVQRLVRYRLV